MYLLIICNLLFWSWLNKCFLTEELCVPYALQFPQRCVCCAGLSDWSTSLVFILHPGAYVTNLWFWIFIWIMWLFHPTTVALCGFDKKQITTVTCYKVLLPPCSTSDPNMPTLHVRRRCFLCSAEQRLLKSSEQVLTYTAEIQRVKWDVHVVKLELGAVSTDCPPWIRDIGCVSIQGNLKDGSGVSFTFGSVSCKYFLPSLQSRQKWNFKTPDILGGKAVMIVDPRLPRALWLVGWITETFPGSAGLVRTWWK